jgi:hypothetical protein
MNQSEFSNQKIKTQTKQLDIMINIFGWIVLVVLTFFFGLAHASVSEPEVLVNHSDYIGMKHTNKMEKSLPGKCDATYGVLPQKDLADLNIPKRVYIHYCYRDGTGTYQLYLFEKQDILVKNERLSSAIGAYLIKMEPSGHYTLQWEIHDHTNEDEAGMYFETKRIEFPDIEGNKIISPILVYKFVALDDSGKINDESYADRLKIIMHYKGIKIAIRAKTGTLDDERATTASGTFFALPSSVQLYLVHKMKNMYEDNIFGFDNSYDFVPRKEKSK